MFSTRPIRDDEWVKIKRFQRHEFKAPERMGFEFMLWLDYLAAKANVPIVIVSSHRTKEHNRSVGGAEDSAHVDNICEAVDIKKHATLSDPNWNYGRAQIVMNAILTGCKRLGIYPNGNIHLDMTHDRRPAPRIWIAVDNPAR
jgi:uncharacterized protein YcbK (DUF882 family)